MDCENGFIFGRHSSLFVATSGKAPILEEGWILAEEGKFNYVGKWEDSATWIDNYVWYD